MSAADLKKVSQPPDARNAATADRTESVEDIEIALLLEGVFRLFGYDFRQYSPNSLKRRVQELLAAEKLDSISALQDRILHQPAARDRFVSALSVQASDFFRDPAFFLSFREKAVPLLRTYPLVRVWHAGCASGEEVYSMAILLEEEHLLSKSLLYATDINTQALQVARSGKYPVQQLEKCENNYKHAGGRKTLLQYFESEGKRARAHSSLRDHIVFNEHNLVSDASFNEFNVILCRNVLIYFTAPLRNRVHELLHASLARFGILALGASETIRLSDVQERYRALDADNNIFRRKD